MSESSFNFSSPKFPENGRPVSLTFKEKERLLLERLRDEKDRPERTLLALANLYSGAGRIDDAIKYLQRLKARADNPEELAFCAMGMGCQMEKLGNFRAAVRFYREGIGFEPADPHTAYFLLNNVGFSMNQLNMFKAGERYCRKAVELDPHRPNGWKNLGLALQGQGRLREAGEAFVSSTRADASDSRSLGHLEELLEDHPELEFVLAEDLEACRKAVKCARQAWERM